MKKVTLYLLLFTFIFTSCSSVKVFTDYDSKTDFKTYKTFAFYKKGIDKAAASDLDKRRILRAIEAELLAKGFKKSEKPDILVSVFVKSRKRVNIRTNFGYGAAYDYWYPGYYYRGNTVDVTQHTEGTLFVDFIDATKKELIWQGIGTGALRAKTGAKKEEKIKVFVKKILLKYPPENKK
ncbi:MAG: DUF4136 domain-containing protein [Polaribacter sp.]|nr:DUF4136 domain-containing protein [Polaribacter sp.]